MYMRKWKQVVWEWMGVLIFILMFTTGMGFTLRHPNLIALAVFLCASCTIYAFHMSVCHHPKDEEGPDSDI